MADHPIAPPPELVAKWLTEGHHQDYCSASEHAIAQAARWAADQELEACEKWLSARTGFMDAHDLRAARRPKPPSLKAQALELVRRIEGAGSPWELSELSVIRRALEQLDD